MGDGTGVGLGGVGDGVGDGIGVGVGGVGDGVGDGTGVGDGVGLSTQHAALHEPIPSSPVHVVDEVTVLF